MTNRGAALIDIIVAVALSVIMAAIAVPVIGGTLEREPVGYRLIENGNFHDRWLRCDDKLFMLGGSIKDFDRGPFTISRVDTTAANRQQFDDAVAQGTDDFGILIWPLSACEFGPP